MSFQTTTTRSLLALLAAALLFADIVWGEEHRFSDHYTMNVDPVARQQLGERTFNEIMAFFETAEKAIEEKDLPALMALYSDSYKDGEHDKKSVEQIWKRIFSRFEGMATHHNMKLVNATAEKNMVILSCSGLLLGLPDPDKGIVTIDNWTNQDHVLVREQDAWKLIGTYGPDRKRLWFDKPIHPLF